MTNQLRTAINNGGPDLTYPMLRDQFFQLEKGKVENKTYFDIKREYAFGMSDDDRIKLLDTMKTDVAIKRHIVKYDSNSFTNPEAIKALRQAALEWSAVQGNDISKVQENDVRSFFRSELIPLVPVQQHEAALALSDQPPEYRKPLPGTIAESLMQSRPWSSNFSGAASTQAMPGPQTQQGVSPLNASASSYPAASTVPWATPNAAQSAPQQGYGTGTTAFNNAIAPSTTNKRSFSAVTGGSASSNDLPPAFKRQRNENVLQAPSYSAAHDFQPPAAPYQPAPYMQPVNNQVHSNYQANVFQNGSFYDPSQSRQSSSWSASNGMGQPTAPYQQPAPQMQPVNNSQAQSYPAYQGGVFQGPNANAPLFAGQPFDDVSGASAPADLRLMADHEFNKTMKFIDSLSPIPPAIQSQIASSLAHASASFASPMMAVSSQTAPVPLPSGATTAQQPLTTGYPAMVPAQALPPIQTPSTGQP